jgi:hypothetical protein
VEYRAVLAAFYQTYLNLIAAGDEVDLAYERPDEAFPIGDYDAVYRVLPSGAVVGGSTGASIPWSSASAGLLVQPNPFVHSTTVRFELPREMQARAQVYDVQGRMVRTLLRDSRLSQGTHVLPWDGRNDAGVSVGSGVFFARVVLGRETHSEKIVLLR